MEMTREDYLEEIKEFMRLKKLGIHQEYATVMNGEVIHVYDVREDAATGRYIIVTSRGKYLI